MNLRKRYCCKKADCHICGRTLEVYFDDENLGDYFVMDISGNFYCANCDIIFNDVDERIYVLEGEE